MKKIVSLVCAVLLLASVCCASAQTIAPLPSEALRSLLAGKTFAAALHGYASNEESYRLSLSLYERISFAPDVIEALQPGDTIALDWRQISVKSVEKDESGYQIKDEWNMVYFLYADENGNYYCVDESEHTMLREVVSFDCVPADGFVYVDASDPDLDAEPRNLALADVINTYLESDFYFTEENTRITFNENGEALTLTRVYTPWN